MFSGGKSEIEDQSEICKKKKKKCQPSSGIFPTTFKTLFLLSHIPLTLMEEKKAKQNTNTKISTKEQGHTCTQRCMRTLNAQT